MGFTLEHLPQVPKVRESTHSDCGVPEKRFCWFFFFQSLLHESVIVSSVVFEIVSSVGIAEKQVFFDRPLQKIGSVAFYCVEDSGLQNNKCRKSCSDSVEPIEIHQTTCVMKGSYYGRLLLSKLQIINGVLLGCIAFVYVHAVIIKDYKVPLLLNAKSN